MSPTYPGLSEINYSESNCAPNYVLRSNCSEPGQPIPNKLNRASSTLRDVQLSPTPNGLTLFKEKSSTSITSSPDSIPLPPIINAQNPSERSNSSLVQRTHPNRSLHMGTGLSHSTSLAMPTCSPSPTELRNSNCISATSFNNSQLNASLNTLGSSRLTKRSGNECPNAGICSSPTLTSSTTYKPCTSIITAQQNQAVPQEVVSSVHLTNLLQRNETNPVGTGIREYAEEEKNCYYLHVCELCLKKGHTSDKCPQGKGLATTSRQQGETTKLGSRPNVE